MKQLVGLAGIGVATLVILAYLIVIWWLDRYEREPLYLVGLTFLWGAVIATGTACAVNHWATGPLAETLGTADTRGVAVLAVAPAVEELTKGLAFLPLLLSHHFDNETDGLIYGAATGLGFAADENLIYFQAFLDSRAVSTGALLELIAMRTFLTALVHCIASATLGVAVGWARHQLGRRRLVAPLAGYVFAVLLHAVWNALAVFSGLHPGLQLAALAFVVVGSTVMFALTQWSLQREHAVLRHHLRREAERGTLPSHHAAILPYWRERRRDDWLPDHVDKQTYIRAATRLAFRHRQLETATGERAERCRRDIAHYRQHVIEALSTPHN